MFTREELKKIKLYSTIAVIIILIFMLLSKLSPLTAYITDKLKVLSPIVVGFMIAYILNIPMRFFETKIYKKLKSLKKRRALALMTTLIACIILLIGFFSFVVPQLMQSAESLVNIVPKYVGDVENIINDLVNKYNFDASIMEKIQQYGAKIIEYVSNITLSIISSAYSISSSVVSGVFNTVLSIVVAIYMLIGKEGLIRTTKKLTLAFLPKKINDKIAHGLEITNKSFNGFVKGQLIEAFIIGALTFVGMTIFRLEYALLISVLVGVTNVIPIFGPFIGAIPAVIILFTVSPGQALGFVIFIVILQQIEGNVIYPRVVGSNIGLSGFWVLVAVIVGNNLYGLLGIIIGIPVFATIYTIVRTVTHKQLKKKRIVVDD